MKDDGISEMKLMIALQRRNNEINQQIVFDASPIILDFAGTSEIGKIKKMYQELLEFSNITASDIVEKFKHNKRIIDITVYGASNLLHQFYLHSNNSIMVRGRAIVKDRSLAPYLSVKTRSLVPGEVEYVVVCFNSTGQIKYGLLSAFASDSYLIHAIPTNYLNRPSTLEKLINGECIHIKFGSVYQFDLKLIKADLYHMYA